MQKSSEESKSLQGQRYSLHMLAKPPLAESPFCGKDAAFLALPIPRIVTEIALLQTLCLEEQ